MARHAGALLTLNERLGFGAHEWNRPAQLSASMNWRHRP